LHHYLFVPFWLAFGGGVFPPTAVRPPDFDTGTPYKFPQKSWSNNRLIDLCFAVISMVFVMVWPQAGNLIFKVVMVLAMFKTLSTLKLISLNLKIRSNSLYTLYATKQMQT
jgi:hypothetical protein